MPCSEEGYDAAMRHYGLAEHIRWYQREPSSISLGAHARACAARGTDTDAIFFCNDDLAQGCAPDGIALGAQGAGARPIAGFNDLPGGEQMLPPLTTVATPRREIGEQAGQMIIDLIRGREVEKRRLDLGFQIVKRQSARASGAPVRAPVRPRRQTRPPPGRSTRGCACKTPSTRTALRRRCAALAARHAHRGTAPHRAQRWPVVRQLGLDAQGLLGSRAGRTGPPITQR